MVNAGIAQKEGTTKKDDDAPRADAAAGGSNILGLGMRLSLWFVSSILFNMTTAMFISMVPTPEDMTLIELSITVLVGTVHLLARGMSLLPASAADLGSQAALGVLFLLNARTFIFSLAYVPISFAQTTRATNPVWVVAICVFFGEYFSWQLLLSLVPLIGGFVLVVGADPRGVPLIGLAASLGSVNAQVLVNMWSKRFLIEKQKLHAFQVQYASCFWALVLLVPVWVAGGGAARLGSHLVALGWEQRRQVLWIGGMNGLLYLAEQCASFSALNMLHPLTFSIIDTIRRLAIVTIAGFWFQGNPCTLVNALGILLVMLGGLQYTVTKEMESRRLQSGAPDAKKTK